MNYEDIKNMSDEEVAEMNKKLSDRLVKEILRAMALRVLFIVGINAVLKMWKRKKS